MCAGIDGCNIGTRVQLTHAARTLYKNICGVLTGLIFFATFQWCSICVEMYRFIAPSDFATLWREQITPASFRHAHCVRDIETHFSSELFVSWSMLGAIRDFGKSVGVVEQTKEKWG